MSRVNVDEEGLPVFGRGPLVGWDVQQTALPAQRERTLRNALLAALAAEANGDAECAYMILTDRIDGRPLWTWLRDGLAAHVAFLGQVAAGGPECPTLTPDEVKAEVQALTAELGSQPERSDRRNDDRTVTTLWAWPDGSWFATVWLPREGVARRLAVRPPLGRPVEERALIPCGGGPEPHTMAECSHPDMVELAGEDLPDVGSEDRAERAAIQAADGDPEGFAGDLAADREEVVRDVLLRHLRSPQAHRATARRAPNGQTGCELCLGAIEPGEDYVAVSATSRRKAHARCVEEEV